MVSYKKSFLAIFMAVLLGTAFITQADPAQNQNTETKDEFEGRSTQVPLDSEPASYIEREKAKREAKREQEIKRERDHLINTTIRGAVMMAVLGAVRCAIAPLDRPLTSGEIFILMFLCTPMCM